MPYRPIIVEYKDSMKDVFTYYNPTIQEIDLQSEYLFEMLHEDDRSPDNPIVSEVMDVLEQVSEIADIRGGYIIFEDIERCSETGEIRIAGRTIKTSRKICRFMEGAEKIAVFICTAGQGFTDYSNKYNKEGEYLKGYITDTLGSVVAEKSMDYIQSELEKKVEQEGLKITNRYSPGYCNWPVDDQKMIFSLLSGHDCDITLSPSCLMTPIKSVSGIIGIGKDVRKSRYSCDICNNHTCIYRKVRNKNIQH